MRGRYLCWRLVRAVVTLLAMIALTFALYFAIEQHPPMSAFGSGPYTAQQIRAVRRLYFLDGSKIRLYFDYVSQLARGEFPHARTIDSSGRVVDAGSPSLYLAPKLRVTLAMLLGGAILVLLLALPLGALAGSRIGSWTDRCISLGVLILLCMHPMMLGLILRSAGGRLDWLPTSGYCPLSGHATLINSNGQPTGTCGGPLDWFTHLLLPWLTFALLFLALYTRMIRASVAETIHEDFVRTAHAKGASETRVLRSHVLPNASLRVLTMVGMEIGTAIGVCIYIEAAYGMQGLGNAAINTLGGNGDLSLPNTVAIVVLITLIVIIGNLLVDLLYTILDPRIAIRRNEGQTKSLVGGVF
jgi:peptide/nickel transport system permease protein